MTIVEAFVPSAYFSVGASPGGALAKNVALAKARAII
jgi:hypothetical protein